MISKILESLTGKDDVERVAGKGDLAALNAYLKTRSLLVPRRPNQFLDASTLTQQELLEALRCESEAAASDVFEPWVLELDGKKRLPAFSSHKKLEVFSKRISQQMNKVFALASAELLIADVTSQLDFDFVDLNLFSEKSWEIGVRVKNA